MNRVPTYRSKKDMVYQILREDILSGTLKPGTRLIIQDLAKAYDVSPIPVREALQQLESDNLIVNKPFAGASVNEIRADVSDIFEIVELMGALDEISSRAACRHITPDGLAQLRQILMAMDEQLEDYESWADNNMEFHQLIAEVAGLHLIPGIMRAIRSQWKLLRRFVLKDVFSHNTQASQKEHWQILAAIEKGDEERVVQLFKKHNQRSFETITQYMAKQ